MSEPLIPNVSNQSGGAMAPPTDEQQAMFEAMVAQTLEDGIAFVMPLMPRSARVDAQTEAICRQVVETHMLKALEDTAGLEPVLRDIIDPVAREAYPLLRLLILQPKAGPDGLPDPSGEKTVAVTIQTAKILPAQDVRVSIQQITSLAMVLGFLTYPPLRALLGAYGFDCMFEQKPLASAQQPAQQPAPVNAPPKLVV